MRSGFLDVPLGSAETQGICINKKKSMKTDRKFLGKVIRKKFKEGSERGSTSFHYTMGQEQKNGIKKGADRIRPAPFSGIFTYFTQVSRIYLTTSQISLSFKVLP